MSIPQLKNDLHIIRGLSDLPNVEDGLTAQQLKDKFDEGVVTVQDWINGTLVPSLTAEHLPFTPSDQIGAENIQDAITLVHSQVRDASSGTIVNGSVTKQKLSAGLLERVYGGRVWVSLAEPGSSDNAASDFPVGQLWLRPGFTVENKAGSWVGSGCSVSAQEHTVTVTADGTVATVTATQPLGGIGQTGDRVYVLFDIQNPDAELQSLTMKLNGGSEQTVGTGGVFAASLSSGGSLSVQLTATWPSLSLAKGSFEIVHFAVVNVDEILRQNPTARDRSDWGSFLKSLLPVETCEVNETVWIHSKDGHWWQVSVDTLPVSRGGTGHRETAKGDLLIGGEQNTMERLAAGTEHSFLQVVDGSPVWTDADSTVAALGALRMSSGSYTGTGEARTLSLPVAAKLLVLSPDGGPVLDGNHTCLWDNPVVLRNGGTVGARGSGREDTENIWMEYVTLTEDRLEFTGPLGNRANVTYGWIAIC